VHIAIAAPFTYIRDMATGDFNGDGKLDVVILWENPVRNIFGISVLFGNGLGGFEPDLIDTDLDPTVFENPVAIAVGDFHEDGKLDVALVNNVPDPSHNCLKILRGGGDGHFPTFQSFRAGKFCSNLAVGTLRTGSSHQDIIVTN